MITVHFSPSAIRDGKVQLWASDTLLKSLGAQRTMPGADRSTLDGGGVIYSWDSTPPGNSVQFALQPTAPGFDKLKVGLPGSQQLDLNILVMP